AFAPSPTVNGMAGASRQGLYLVRMVAVDNADCQHCRGWLTVGRLDANASATAENTAIPYDGTRIHTASELEAALQKDRDAWVGKAVLVDGSVTSSPPGDSCDVIGGASSSMCILGALDGTREDVYASGFTAALANPDSLHPRGTIALRVLAGGLEYLGRLGNARDPDFQVSPDVLAASIQQDDVLQVFVVDGYLGTSGAVPCPLVPGSPPPENTPFQRCPWAWLGPTAASGHTANEVFLPADAVQVQFGAYRDFAPGATAASFDPKFGTYLVRLVTDTRQGANGARGWQVVARLAP
ncbi:MAG TPA: hypothetical protein VIH37_02870, partial [Candidatus Limnocylindrales bacterium]